ncbi:MAG: hypothetical protein AAGD05_05155, partial [Bacteroidota bacterium]
MKFAAFQPTGCHHLSISTMILFFGHPQKQVFAVQVSQNLDSLAIQKLNWLFANQPQIEATEIEGLFLGPR